jgi:flavodoxin/Pyruvate/2-oxoacid:ferredoxin oxidoreductase delta subunit
MPKGLIVYFSQGGTTAKAAECIAKGIRDHKFQVDVYTIKNKKPDEVKGYDFLGIGSPVYACRIPFNVSDYVKALPPLNNMPVFSFNLYGTYPFDAGKQLRRLLAKKGAKDMGYFSCKGPEYNLGYLQKGYLFSPNNPSKEELTQAEAFGREVAARISGKSYTPSEKFRSPSLFYRIERAFCDRWIVENMAAGTYKVDRTICNSCGVCIKLCPNTNIQKDKDGFPKWGRNCLFCLTCEMKCPRDAIKSMADKLGLIMDYNIRDMSKNKSLEYVRVKHQQGRTEILK